MGFLKNEFFKYTFFWLVVVSLGCIYSYRNVFFDFFKIQKTDLEIHCETNFPAKNKQKKRQNLCLSDLQFLLENTQFEDPTELIKDKYVSYSTIPDKWIGNLKKIQIAQTIDTLRNFPDLIVVQDRTLLKFSRELSEISSSISKDLPANFADDGQQYSKKKSQTEHGIELQNRNELPDLENYLDTPFLINGIIWDQGEGKFEVIAENDYGLFFDINHTESPRFYINSINISEKNLNGLSLCNPTLLSWISISDTLENGVGLQILNQSKNRYIREMSSEEFQRLKSKLNETVREKRHDIQRIEKIENPTDKQVKTISPGGGLWKSLQDAQLERKELLDSRSLLKIKNGFGGEKVKESPNKHPCFGKFVVTLDLEKDAEGFERINVILEGYRIEPRPLEWFAEIALNSQKSEVLRLTEIFKGHQVVHKTP